MKFEVPVKPPSTSNVEPPENDEVSEKLELSDGLTADELSSEVE